MRRILIALLFIISLFIISCGGGAYKLRSAKAPASSMIYGYLNTSNADLTGNCWVSLRRYVGERKDRRYIAECDELGFFWTQNLPAGTYKTEKFGNHAKFLDEPGGLRVIRNLNDFRREHIIEINKPGLYYYGSWEVSRGGSGSFGPGMQFIEKSKRRTEEDALKAMLPNAGGTTWEPKIESRLSALKGK